MAFQRRNKRDDKKKKKSRIMSRPRVCRFCVDKKIVIDYKDARILMPFLTERGKIVPRRISGNCSKHQRAVTLAIKRGRTLAMITCAAPRVSAPR